MKKIFLLIICITIVFGCIFNLTVKASAASNMPQANSQRNKDELIITLLTPEIQKAVTNYYGENRRYEIGDSKVEILQRGDGQNYNIFKVKVKVDTFEGPHNNYFTEILVFTVTPSSITLNDYNHSEFIPNIKIDTIH